MAEKLWPGENAWEPILISVELSPQAVSMLDELTAMGLYGLSREEVAGRFIDKALIGLYEARVIELPKGKGKANG